MENLFPDPEDLLDPPKSGREATGATARHLFGDFGESRIIVSPSYAGDSSAWSEALQGEVMPSRAAEVARTIGILSKPRSDVAPEPQPAGEDFFQRLRRLQLSVDDVGEPKAQSVDPSRVQAGVRSDVVAIPVASAEGRELEEAKVRERFTKGLLEDLKTLQASAGTPLASLPANRMLHDLRDLRDLMPFDPFVEVAMALYDGLVFEDRWCELGADQYEGLHGIFAELPRGRELSEEEVVRAILAIERMGIDTTPLPAVAEGRRGEESEGDGDR